MAADSVVDCQLLLSRQQSCPRGNLCWRAGAALVEQVYRVWVAHDQATLVLRVPAATTDGSRGALLFIHGFAQNVHTFHVVGSGASQHDSDRSLLHHLALDGYDCFAMDLRGSRASLRFGQTRPPPLPSDYATVDVPAVLRAVASISGRSRAVLVGHSLGAAIACAAAGVVPELVAGVVTLAGLYRFGSGWSSLHGLWLALRACDVTFIKAALFWNVLLLLGVHRWGPALLERLDVLPTRAIGIAGTLVNSHPLLGHLLPLQAFLPGSIAPHLAYRHRAASFENFSAGLFGRLLEIVEHGCFYDIDGRNLFAAFEQRDDLPLLVLCSKQDTLVSFADSSACFHASRSRDRTLFVFGTSAGYSQSTRHHHSRAAQLCRHFGLDPAHLEDARFGHLDLVIGEHSPQLVWPLLSHWLNSLSNLDETNNI